VLGLATSLAIRGAHGGAVVVQDPVEFVNVLTGTAGGAQGQQHHSTGNVLPVTSAPWGFNHWAPQTTNDKTSWWFDANADTFRGLRCTHQPSPWIGDYGWFVIRPQFGIAGDTWLGFTSYHGDNVLRPWLIDVSSGPHGVRMELAPTDHGAAVRVSFPDSIPATARMLCVWMPFGGFKDGDEVHARRSGRPSGTCSATPGGLNVESRRFSGGMPGDNTFTFHARIEPVDMKDYPIQTMEEMPPCFEEGFQYTPLDMPGQGRTTEKSADACQQRCASVAGCEHFTSWPDGGCHISDKGSKKTKQNGVTVGPAKCPGPLMTRQCCFLLGERSSLELRIGTSFISADQAKEALDREVRDGTLEDLAEAARAMWSAELGKVMVQDAGPNPVTAFRRLQVFYTSLYRALLFPRRLDESTTQGIKHWSPYDGKVHEGRGVTDNGFWDTFRTVYPFLSLAYPMRLGEIIDGWLNAYRAGGWLPKWASPGYRDMMIGTFADVVLADAIIKNISGFDYDVAWQAMRKDAYEVSGPKDTSRGKFGLSYYRDQGYIPVDVKVGEACSRTLDFAYADAATATAARRLGKTEDADVLVARSRKALEMVYNPRSRLMGRKKASGGWQDKPDDSWGNCFTEGSAWHHSFPPFDLAKLAELHGGEDRLLSRLKDLFTTPGNFGVGSYKVEIHEMREMRMLGLGQYAHNNQPVHHIPFLFALLGDRNTTSHIVRRILTNAFSPDGFAGDEDNGEMGSWYLLAALGLYSTAPGINEDYVLASMPLFPRVRLTELGLDIVADGAMEGRGAEIIAEVAWKSRPWHGAAIPYSMLRNGGTLRFAGDGGHIAVSGLQKTPSTRERMEHALRGRRPTDGTHVAEAVAASDASAGPPPRLPHRGAGTFDQELGLRHAASGSGLDGWLPLVLGAVGASGLLWLVLAAIRQMTAVTPSKMRD